MSSVCSVVKSRNITHPDRALRKRCVQVLARKLLRAAYVMGPTLAALSLAGITNVAHAQGTMDFSGAQTLMTTFNNFTIERQVEPLVLESEISGLADLHAFMKYQNFVTYFSFPYFDMPEIAKPFELRERPDDKLPYDPKAIRGNNPETSPAELKQEPEATAPPEPQSQPNAPAAVQELQQETTLPDDTSEQQSLTFKG